jgi:hypothetical protein
MAAGGLTSEISAASPFKVWRNVRDGTLRKRAYKLARSGVCKSLTEIGGRLKVEGYSVTSIDEFLEERIRADLARIINAADGM